MAIQLDPRHASVFVNAPGPLCRPRSARSRHQRLRQALRLDPTNGRALRLRGKLHDQRASSTWPSLDFDDAIELDPTDALALDYRGQAYSDKGQYEQAIRDFDAAIRLRSELAWSMPTAAWRRGGSEQVERGDQGLQRCYPTGAARRDRAMRPRPFLRRLGRTGPRPRGFRRRRPVDPTSAEAYQGRGFAYDSLGKFERAIGDYSEAIRLKPDLADAYLQPRLCLLPQETSGSRDRRVRCRPPSGARCAGGYLGRGLAYELKHRERRRSPISAPRSFFSPRIPIPISFGQTPKAREGEDQQAIADSDQAVRLDPHNGALLISRGFVLSPEPSMGSRPGTIWRRPHACRPTTMAMIPMGGAPLSVPGPV